MGTRQKELLDIDSSSVILEDGITKLNTIGHYEVRAGLSPDISFPEPHPDLMRSSPGNTIKILLKKLQNSHCFLA